VVSVVVSLVFSFRSAARSRAALHLEILALRHQVAVLNRSRAPRLRLTTADRALWAWLTQAWSGWQPALVLVKPDTVLAWHDAGSACSGRGRVGTVRVVQPRLQRSAR
jgi:putative transposase